MILDFLAWLVVHLPDAFSVLGGAALDDIARRWREAVAELRLSLGALRRVSDAWEDILQGLPTLEAT